MELNKEQILSADDLQIEEMEIPEWGGTIYIRVMTGTERNLFVQDIYTSEDKEDEVDLSIRFKLCAATIVNSKGERLFSESEIETLSNKSFIVLDRIYRKAEILNCIDDAEKIVKNSEETQSEDSVSD